MSDLDEFRRIEAEATVQTERLLGPRPTINVIPVCLLTAVGAYLVLMIFSFVTGTIEHSEMVILVFVLAIAGLTYWALRSREMKWIRKQIETRLRSVKQNSRQRKSDDRTEALKKKTAREDTKIARQDAGHGK